MKNIRRFNIIRRFVIPSLILILIYFLGSVGYMLIEDMSFLDALFMTTITITTVGYGVVKELTTAGVIYTIILIIIGTGVAAYILVNIADFFLSEFLLGRFEKRRMVKMITKLNNHYIICGMGRVGMEIAVELKKNNEEFIVIDNADEPIETCKQNNWLFVQGNASDDDTLIEAGIKRANALFAALDTDSENVFVTLSAKALNPDIFVVGRAKAFDTISKLEKAGANRVVSPQILGGRRMATMAIQPSVVDFIDSVLRSDEVELRLADIIISEKSELVDMTISEASAKFDFGALIISIIENEKKISVSRASGSSVLKAGCKLIAIGTKEQILKLSDLANATGN